MSWAITFIIIFIILVILVFIHFYSRSRTFKSLDNVLKKKNWDKLSKKEYLMKCYNLVGDHFVWKSQCWIKYPWKNFYYRNIWNLKDECLPCHIQNALFQYCLLKKFGRDEIKTKFTNDLKQKILVHFYTLVKLGGKWLDADVHKRNDGVPFGKNIHTAKR